MFFAQGTMKLGKVEPNRNHNKNNIWINVGGPNVEAPYTNVSVIHI